MTGDLHLDLAERVLYRDGLILIIDKPAGVAVHAGPGGGPNLESGFDALRFGLRHPPALAHRLDRDTSGCLVLGRHPKALRRLGTLFAEGKVEKVYWAVAEGRPAQDAGRIETGLRKLSRAKGWRMIVDPAGQRAVTDYRVLGVVRGRAWLELRPRTGRTHQLRVHCAALGCPVAGDAAYGRAAGGTLLLHARAITVPLYPARPPIAVTACAPPQMRATPEHFVERRAMLRSRCRDPAFVRRRRYDLIHDDQPGRRYGSTMIKRFHALYVGQIALDNIGLDGTPANDRRYPNKRLSEVFWTARDVARVMDEEGYYAFWTAEHHFQHEGYECLPNLIQLGLWLATQTKRLKFGCGFNILPMWHPIRLAEDYAMADIVTDGRVIMGVGRGYHTREVETFGAPLLDTDANREIFEEGLQLLLKCFNEESFRHKGKYFECPPRVPYRGYQLDEITMVPRPKNLPVEIWMPIASGRTIDLMAQHGFKAMVTLNGEKILDDVVRAYHAACLRHGQNVELGQNMCWGAGLYLASSREEAMRRVEPSHDERYKWFAPFGFVRYADEEGRTWGTPGAPSRVPSLADGVAQKAWFCGTPAEVIDGIKSIEAKYPGLEDFMIHWAEGLPPDEFKDQLRWFARDVMPAFDRG